jgi:hypothetical protein
MSVAIKKLYERSESIVLLPLILLFLKFMKILAKKLPLRTERKRSSIEFERSENIGQFFKLELLIIFNTFKCF